ncbi:hypothetical protein L2E82_22340 [Cichorium intybus]|uniref:Uncharacterized protein n=1 Tax=Cichorium intybus TaxID=13427 RepID=A0ACB9DX69_CICIN|nr:hypothetical protein L2E82_22340 [Cichorium intybus]
MIQVAQTLRSLDFFGVKNIDALEMALDDVKHRGNRLKKTYRIGVTEVEKEWFMFKPVTVSSPPESDDKDDDEMSETSNQEEDGELKMIPMT